MRDYLTNLAARSLDSTPAIKPRLTSLFEPVRDPGVISEPGLGAQRLEGIDNVDTGVAVPNRRADELQIEPARSFRQITRAQVFEDAHPEYVGEPARLSEQERPKPPAASNPTVQPSTSGRTVSETANRVSTVTNAALPAERPAPPPAVPVFAVSSAHERPDREDTTSAARAQRAVKAEIDRPPVNVISEALRPPVEPPHHQAIEPRISEARSELRGDDRPRVDLTADEPQQERQLSPRLIVPHIEVEGTRAEHNQPPAPSAVQHSKSDTGNVRRPSTAPMDSPWDSWARRSADIDTKPLGADTAVEPIINVTIGRVEVRAELPTTERQKVRSSTPASRLMNLDDYLRQRAQGGKR